MYFRGSINKVLGKTVGLVSFIYNNYTTAPIQETDE